MSFIPLAWDQNGIFAIATFETKIFSRNGKVPFSAVWSDHLEPESVFLSASCYVVVPPHRQLSIILGIVKVDVQEPVEFFPWSTFFALTV